MRFYICVLCCCFYFNVFAQTIRGKVTGPDHKGIALVSVGIVGSNTITVTNDSGEFELKGVNQSGKLRFSHVSYQSLDTLIKDELIVRLTPAHITLKEVTVKTIPTEQLLKSALEKAAKNAAFHHYGNAFYRQLTSLNNKPFQIYELFYDIDFNPQKIQGWIARQTRFAQENQDVNFTFNNLSYLTFSLAGYLFREKPGKFITLNSIPDYNIKLIHYIEKDEQSIAVINCMLKSPKKNEFYANSLFYIGLKDFLIYRVESQIYHTPMKFDRAVIHKAPELSTIVTFKKNSSAISILESVSTKLFLPLKIKRTDLNVSASSMLLVYQLNDELKTQQFNEVVKNTTDHKTVNSITYNADFWKNNPVVKQTSLENSFIKLMESKSAFGTMINP
ncbi:carboxypeptidase-like regulatory domain-containing protein [Pedobacter montanisoli]|uniref:Carboxypeptidase-like regulatory domain-containing protein n=1 Tax=Pedobacter montanisoli TaxID=2923277 RepID=A0ABS9ZXJ8_9SPHI|nr:carboxypeptidase-like regulatory domain-containing protein [Pedobacter montanisoli]MCJ0743046.1 carboxypeptidase-like regulatory domain-containing protein [Pedobacter montanisoli]